MTTGERPPSSEEMIRLAREAARDPAEIAFPESTPVAPETTTPGAESSRRLLNARRRHLERAVPDAGTAPPGAQRNARALAAVVLAIALLGFGIAILIAAMAATP